jgi:hypothetical protein
MVSLYIPVVGPFIDALWAPVAAGISFKMFGEKIGKYTSLITFIEEIFPFADIVPSFTIFWFLFDLLKIGSKKNNLNNITIT